MYNNFCLWDSLQCPFGCVMLYFYFPLSRFDILNMENKWIALMEINEIFLSSMMMCVWVGEFFIHILRFKINVEGKRYNNSSSFAVAHNSTATMIPPVFVSSLCSVVVCSIFSHSWSWLTVLCVVCAGGMIRLCIGWKMKPKKKNSHELKDISFHWD